MIKNIYQLPRLQRVSSKHKSTVLFHTINKVSIPAFSGNGLSTFEVPYNTPVSLLNSNTIRVAGRQLEGDIAKRFILQAGGKLYIDLSCLKRGSILRTMLPDTVKNNMDYLSIRQIKNNGYIIESLSRDNSYRLSLHCLPEQECWNIFTITAS